MKKKSIKDIEIKGKRVLIRVDFNVPMEDGAVSDDTRIRAALPTIQHALQAGASVVLMSHSGRPKGKVKPEFSLKPAAERLSELLGVAVGFAPDCIGQEAAAMAQALQPGQVMLLENLRFYPEEEGKPELTADASDADKQAAKAEMKQRQTVFAQRLAALGDVYVNDAFGTAHRAHASMVAVASFFADRVAGLLMEKELTYLSGALENPERPFVALLGGAKISGKIDVIMALVEKVDAILIGGGMVYTFYRAMGIPVGQSLVEEEKIEVARDTLAAIKAKGVKFLLPTDFVIADAFSAEANTKVVGKNEIPDDWQALDMGPESIKAFSAEIQKARTIIWNGPVGCFEMAPFANGTMSLTRCIAETDGTTIVGGGDSVSAVNKSGLSEKFTHISTGGGASLELLEGKPLPGVEALSDQ